MGEAYLNSDSKTSYMKDFELNVLPEKDDFWKVSEMIAPSLKALNSCGKLQPLYSKYPDNRNSLNKNLSYLDLAYFKELEADLKNISNKLGIIFNTSSEDFSYEFRSPKMNANYRESSKFRMGCVSSPDHFRITHIRFEYKHWNIDKHNEFWDTITKELCSLPLKTK